MKDCINCEYRCLSEGTPVCAVVYDHKRKHHLMLCKDARASLCGASATKLKAAIKLQQCCKQPDIQKRAYNHSEYQIVCKACKRSTECSSSLSDVVFQWNTSFEVPTRCCEDPVLTFTNNSMGHRIQCVVCGQRSYIHSTKQAAIADWNSMVRPHKCCDSPNLKYTGFQTQEGWLWCLVCLNCNHQANDCKTQESACSTFNKTRPQSRKCPVCSCTMTTRTNKVHTVIECGYCNHFEVMRTTYDR